VLFFNPLAALVVEEDYMNVQYLPILERCTYRCLIEKMQKLRPNIDTTKVLNVCLTMTDFTYILDLLAQKV
jgi:hypothetical protein